MLDVLDVEDDEEGEDSDDGGPEAEISCPYACKVFDLKGGLYSSRGDEGSKGSLAGAFSQSIAQGLFLAAVLTSLA